MAIARKTGFFERHAGKLALSLVITVALWYALHRGGLKFLPEGLDFQQVRWWVVPVYLASLLVMTWFRSVRWRFLLRSIADVPKKRLLAISCIGFAAIVILPSLGLLYVLDQKSLVSADETAPEVAATPG